MYIIRNEDTDVIEVASPRYSNLESFGDPEYIAADSEELETFLEREE